MKNWLDKYQKAGQVSKYYTWNPNAASERDSVQNIAGNILNYEILRGGPGGSPLTKYSDPMYMSMLMDDIYPQVKKMMPNASPQELGEAMDFVFNSGWDKDNKKILIDPRAYAIQEYYKVHDKSKLDKEGNWAGRKAMAGTFDKEYANTVGKLSENERRIMMNKGRDWFYQHRAPQGSTWDLKTQGAYPDYKATWYGRIWNTNDYAPFDPKNPKFIYPKKSGGAAPSWSRNPEGNWVAKAQKGLNYVSEPTRADSLELLNNSRQILNYYRSQDYREDSPEYLKKDSNKDGTLKYLIEQHKNYDPNMGRRTEAGPDIHVPLDQYYKTSGRNKFYQKETANTILDTRSPMSLYDRRIKPTVYYSFENVKKGDPLEGDLVSIAGYDPLSITPWDMLTDEQKKLRVKRFGRNGVPEDYDPEKRELTYLKPIEVNSLPPLYKPEDRLIREFTVQQLNPIYKEVYDYSPYSLKKYGPEGAFSHYAKQDEKIPGVWRPVKGKPSDLYVSKKVKFKSGGWLEQYQVGRQYNKYDIMSGVYDDMRQAAVPSTTYVDIPIPTEKEIKTVQAEAQRVKKKMKETGAKSEAEVYAKEKAEKEFQKAAATIVANQGTIDVAKEKTAGDYLSQAWDIASNPATALGYKVRGQEIPWGFAKGDKNAFDLPLSLINPASYINAFGRLADAAVTPETYTQVIPQTIGAIAMSVSGDQYPENWDESAWKMLGLGLDAGMLKVNPFKIPRRYAIGYKSPSGGRAALGDLEYIAANNPKLLGSLETPAGTWSLAKARPNLTTAISKVQTSPLSSGSTSSGLMPLLSAVTAESVSPLQLTAGVTTDTPSLASKINIGNRAPKTKPKVYKKREVIPDDTFSIERAYRKDPDIPNEIKIKGKSGDFKLYRNTGIGQENTFHFSTEMANPFEAGKAMLKMDKLLPANEGILETKSYSLDSYATALNLKNRPGWTMEYTGDYIPLNHSAIHNKSISSKLGIEPTPETFVFNSIDDATSSLNDVNKLLVKQGIDLKARVVKSPTDNTFQIEIPNFKFIKSQPPSPKNAFLSSVVDQSPLQKMASSSQNSILGPGFKTDPFYHLKRFEAKKSNILQHLESSEGRRRLQQYIKDNPHLNKYSVDDIIDRFRNMTFTTSRPHYRGSDASGKTIYEPWYEQQIDDLIKAGTIDPAYKYDPSTVGPNAGIIIDKNGNLVELNVEPESGFHWAKHGPGNPSVMNIGSGWSPYDAEHILEHEFAHFFQHESPLVLDHELSNIELKDPFELMQQKSPSYLDAFKDFTSRLNPFTPYDKGYSVTSSHLGFLNRNNSARYWKRGSQGMEKTPFVAEIRENLLQRGLIKDRYDPITPDILRQHHKLYDKTKGNKYRIRLYDVMTKNNDNYLWLSHVLNKMPAAVPLAIGAGALMNEKDGGWLDKYQVGGTAMSFLDELRPYQNALINEPTYFDEAKQFVTDWHNSPMYNQMVLNSFHGNQKNADYLTKLRKENLRTLPPLTISAFPNQEGNTNLPSSIRTAAYSQNNTGAVHVFPPGYEYGPSLYTHEILHSSDRPRELYKWDHPTYKTGLPVDYFDEKGINLGRWGLDEKGNVVNYPDWMLYYDPRFPGEYAWMDRVMPISDQMYITRNRGSNYKDNQDYKNNADYFEAKDWPSNLEEDMKLNPGWYAQNYDWTIDSKEKVDKSIKDEKAAEIKRRSRPYEKEWKQYAHDYVSQPTEVRARLGEIRLNAKKEGIYDPFTEKLTPEKFQEYINKKREDSNWQPMKPIKELRRDFTDDEILWMLQNISYNDKKDNTISSGKYGGSSKSLNKYQKGSQVKTYASDPSYFDNRAVYHDDPRFNDLIRSKVYAGTHGWDPTNNSLVKLDKPVVVPKAVQQMSTADWGKKSHQERVTSKTPAGKETRKAIAAKDMEQAVTNPYFRGAIPAMMLPGVPALGEAAYAGLMSTPVGAATAGALATDIAPGLTVGTLGQGLVDSYFAAKAPGQLMTANQNFRSGDIMEGAVNTGLAAMNLFPFYQYIPKAQGPGPLMILDDASKGVSRAKGDEPHLSEWQKLRIAEGKPVYTGSNPKGNMTMREIQAQKDLQKSVKSKTKPKKLSKEEEYERLLRESYQRTGGSIKGYQDGGDYSKIPQSWKDKYDWTPNVEEEYQKFKNDYMAPENLRFTDDLNDYNTRGMWDSLDRPSDWQQALALYKQQQGEDWTPEDDGYYHAWSQHPGTGEWLKPKHHPTGWMNYMGYAFDPENTVVVNPEGFFGNETLQAYPKKKKGGVKSSAEGYYDYINGYSGIFANGGTKGWLDNYK